jgi:hypothetical protein
MASNTVVAGLSLMKLAPWSLAHLVAVVILVVAEVVVVVVVVMAAAAAAVMAVVAAAAAVGVMAVVAAVVAVTSVLKFYYCKKRATKALFYFSVCWSNVPLTRPFN